MLIMFYCSVYVIKQYCITCLVSFENVHTLYCVSWAILSIKLQNWEQWLFTAKSHVGVRFFFPFCSLFSPPPFPPPPPSWLSLLHLAPRAEVSINVLPVAVVIPPPPSSSWLCQSTPSHVNQEHPSCRLAEPCRPDSWVCACMCVSGDTWQYHTRDLFSIMLLTIILQCKDYWPVWRICDSGQIMKQIKRRHI